MVAIFVVAEDRFQAWTILRRDASQQLRCGGAIVQVGPRDQHRHEQAERVDQQMSLPSFDFLTAIIATLFTAHVGRLRRLAVDADRAGRLFAARGLANLRPQRI
ncbi:MAG TPA: hypothetical protein VEO53_00610, partial [Candidatus Binatia bacterium]|nr:hypothetical protein [Candidatus Binatia bacterium]